MCGVFGMVTNVSNGFAHQDIKLMQDMMTAGAVRGVDGCGLFGVTNKRKSHYIKHQLNPYFILYNEHFPKFNSNLIKEGVAFVGHNRAATVGEINNKNTHPFNHKHITMVHNGTISSGLDVPKNMTDSEQLTIQLAEEGPEIFKSINGAWTCIWYDGNNHTLNFLKNGQRPFHMQIKEGYTTYTYKGNQTESYQKCGDIYFASEEDMLKWLLKRNNIYGTKEKIIANDMLYTYDLDTKKFYTEDLAKKYYSTTPISPHGTNNYPNYSKITTEVTENKSTNPINVVKESKLKKSDEIIFQILDIRNRSVTSSDNMLYYYGLSVDNELVFFQTIKTEFKTGQWYLGKILAPCKLKHSDKIWYSVKARELIEIDDDEIEESLNKDYEERRRAVLVEVNVADNKKEEDVIVSTSNNMLHLQGGDSITERNMAELLLNNKFKCFACQEFVHRKDYLHCSLVPDSKTNTPLGVLCKDCTGSWQSTFKNKISSNEGNFTH